MLFSYGTPLSLEDHLNAVSLNVSVEGVLKYSHSAGSVLDVGCHDITATFDPLDNERYNTTEVIRSLQIEPLEPNIVWNQDCQLFLTFGEVISEKELLSMFLSADTDL